MEQVPALITVLVILFGVMLLQKSRRKLMVYQYEEGLLYKNGKLERVLPPGRHVIFALGDDINLTRLDKRRTSITITGQELLTADNVNLKVSVACAYEIADAEKALHSSLSYREDLYLETQMAARTIIASHTLEEMLEKRLAIGDSLLERVVPAAEALGLKVHRCEIKDVILPGELKRIYNEVLRAKKEGQASLERARGETAALRSLANAAKMMEENPALLNLRLLQSLGSSNGPGNTLVMGIPGLVPIGAKEAGKPAPKSGRTAKTPTDD